jgi:hypothetical protein
MPMRNFCLVLLVIALAACVGGKTPPPKENPITGGAISTTSLDSPAAPVAPAGGTAKPATPPADPAVAGAGAGPAAKPATPAPGKPDPAKPDAAGAKPAPDLTVQTPPPAPASPEEAACRKSGGNWANAGGKALRSCVHVTKDAGKQCSRASQCDGLCLARSGSCAPIKPLFGCNEIFQDDGARVTLCID